MRIDAALRRGVAAVLRDRLSWFFLAGGLIFLADWGLAQRETRVITIDPPLVAKLAVQWEAQIRRPPTAQEIDGLIAGYIREEILMREAVALGLDADDTIVRRRLAQKAEFLLTGETPADPPDEATLRTFFDTHADRYASPARVGFRHVFVSDEARAADVLEALRARPEDWRALGQPFILQRAYADRTLAELTELFGGDFAAALFAAAPEQGEGWFGPLRSAYGWHVLAVSRYTPPQAGVFEAERVAADWNEARRRDESETAWQELRARYRVRFTDGQ